MWSILFFVLLCYVVYIVLYTWDVCIIIDISKNRFPGQAFKILAMPAIPTCSNSLRAAPIRSEPRRGAAPMDATVKQTEGANRIIKTKKPMMLSFQVSSFSIFWRDENQAWQFHSPSWVEDSLNWPRNSSKTSIKLKLQHWNTEFQTEHSSAHLLREDLSY